MEKKIINPLVLHNISYYDKNVNYTIVFFLYIDETVKKILLNYSNKITKSNIKILSDYFGKDWEFKLGIQYTNIYNNKKYHTNANKEGNLGKPNNLEKKKCNKGDNTNDEVNNINDEVNNINDEVNNTNDEVSNINNKEENVVDIIDKYANDDNELQYDFSSILDEADNEETDKSKVESLTTLVTQKSNMKPLMNDLDYIEVNNRKIYLSFDDNILMLPEDNIMELKNKIYLYTGINIYKQYITILHVNKLISVSFQHYLSDIPFSYDINELRNNADTKMIANIPISIKYVSLIKNIKTTTTDDNRLVNYYLENYNTNVFNLIDFDEFSIKNQKELISIIDGDPYKMDLIYYGFIYLFFPMIDYKLINNIIKNDDTIFKKYPLLELSTKSLKEKYSFESKINKDKIKLLMNENELKKVEEHIEYSIIHSSINVLEYGLDLTKILSIRNLFDMIELNDEIIICQGQIYYDTNYIIFTKTYKANQVEQLIFTIEEIIIFKIIDSETGTIFKLLIYPNGNYRIDTKWKHEDNIKFEEVIKISAKVINPIIKKINDMEEIVFNSNKRLPLLTKKNIKIPVIDININYKKALTIKEFAEFKKILDIMINAEHFLVKNNGESIIETFLIKSIFQFNEHKIKTIFTNVKNQYNYLIDDILYQKWLKIKRKTQVKFIHRFSDIRIEITQINDKEFPIFQEYLFILFYKIMQIKNKNIGKNDSNNIISRQKKESLKTLKEKDPILYKYSQYKTNLKYSKICQKKFQPSMIDQREFNELPQKEKQKYTKYWNFTTNTPAYYICNKNSEYNNVRFLIDKHPMKYCLPCCRIKPVESSEDVDIQKKIHNTCLKTYQWLDTKENKTSTTYVIGYGKPIKDERLSYLPDIFKKIFINVTEQGMSNSYYLYGINNVFKDYNMGIINIMANAIDISIIDLIADVIKKIKSATSIYTLILNGEINDYFNSYESFIKVITTIFFTDESFTEYQYLIIPWDKIFIDIFYLYYGIKIFVFIDNGNIDLEINSKIYSVNDLFTTDKYIFVLTTNFGIFPIYLLNENVYKKTKVIYKKIFGLSDNILSTISNIIQLYIDTDSSLNKDKKNIRTLSVIDDFINSQKRYKISNYLVNGHNMLYGVIITDNVADSIFIPISLSHYDVKLFDKATSHDLIYQNTFDNLMMFVELFNNYSKNYKIIINNWVEYNDNIIGFYDSIELNYYFKKITKETALNVINAPIIKFFYNPHEININILNNANNLIEDERIRNLPKCFYKHNIYKLLCLEFLNITKNSKNIKKRLLIRDTVDKTDFNNHNEYDSFNKTMNNILENKDFESLSKVIKYVMELGYKNYKQHIIEEIEKVNFDFDNELINDLKKLNIATIIKRLESSILPYVDIVDKFDPKSGEIINILKSCSLDDTMFYCNKKKLIIEKETFDKCLKILAYEIINPYKNDMVFKKIFIDNVINKFHFIKRKDENIFIEYL